jgi:hypothetical protein
MGALDFRRIAWPTLLCLCRGQFLTRALFASSGSIPIWRSPIRQSTIAPHFETALKAVVRPLKIEDAHRHSVARSFHPRLRPKQRHSAQCDPPIKRHPRDLPRGQRPTTTAPFAPHLAQYVGSRHALSVAGAKRRDGIGRRRTGHRGKRPRGKSRYARAGAKLGSRDAGLGRRRWHPDYPSPAMS